ncbi:hypothetical protein OPT61_g4573 [Boeremia exigua]|uniref:Uncharacterized protein n=1 Tax=Boeremia exigua TaxID=749465 RepID=A0ACC2IDR1_9PLEO|nr:hypothetical protein OPT61_g4573 [Boeremia exigua]
MLALSVMLATERGVDAAETHLWVSPGCGAWQAHFQLEVPPGRCTVEPPEVAIPERSIGAENPLALEYVVRCLSRKPWLRSARSLPGYQQLTSPCTSSTQEERPRLHDEG